MKKPEYMSFYVCMINGRYRCTYLNDCRIHGNKPWSDEHMIHLVASKIKVNDLLNSMPSGWKNAILDMYLRTSPKVNETDK